MHITVPRTFFSVILTTVFAVLLYLLPLVSHGFYAGAPVDLEGYGWSSTIGWISLNCETGGVGRSNVCSSTGNYKLTIQTNGTVTGYAWNNNIGWIKFGGLYNFPSAAGVTAANARLFNVGGGNFELRGWARACAGTTSGTCSNMNSRTDGWDGWISLNGNTHSIRYALAGAAANSFAWGGPVIGWIDMASRVTYDPPKSATISLTSCVIGLNQSQCNGGLSYTFTNVLLSDNPRILRISPAPNQVVASGAVSGSGITVPLRAGSNTFRASVNGNSNLATRSVTAVCLPNASPNASGTCVCNAPYLPVGTQCIIPEINFDPATPLIRQGDTTSFTMSVSGSNPVCSISGPGITGQEEIYNSGGVPRETPVTIPPYTTVPLYNLALFTLTCTGVFTDTREVETQVRVVPVFQEN